MVLLWWLGLTGFAALVAGSYRIGCIDGRVVPLLLLCQLDPTAGFAA
jgi:hypothetical protein